MPLSRHRFGGKTRAKRRKLKKKRIPTKKNMSIGRASAIASSRSAAIASGRAAALAAGRAASIAAGRAAA